LKYQNVSPVLPALPGPDGQILDPETVEIAAGNHLGELNLRRRLSGLRDGGLPVAAGAGLTLLQQVLEPEQR
jgi:hypothetical protein